MKLKRLMTASMAAVMAVSSAIVCEITASAEVVVWSTEKTLSAWDGTKISLITKGQPTDDATITFTIDELTLQTAGDDIIFKVCDTSWQEIKTIKFDANETTSKTEYSIPYSKLNGATKIVFQAGHQPVVLKKVTVSNVVSEAYPGNKITLPKNPYGTNYQGEFSLGGINGVTAATDLFTKASKIEVKFQINGATSNGADFDITKIRYSLVPKIYSGDLWPWVQVVGTTAYDAATKTVTITADITKDLFAKIDDIKTYTFSELVLVSSVNESDTSAQVELFIEDPIVTATSNAVESVKITDLDGKDVASEYTYGDTINLKANVTPTNAVGADKVEWASENPTVATVDENGKVTLLKAGEAKITAIAGDVSQSVFFTVNKKKLTVAPSALTNIYVRDNEIEAAAKAVTAKYALENDENVSLVKGTDYTVSEPQISADKKYYSITITLSDDAAGKYELSTTTLKGYIAYELTSVALNSDTLNLVAGANGRQLVATTTPDNALLDNLTFTYKSSDETVATVDENGLVTPLKAGTATITVTAQAVVTTNGMALFTTRATAKCTVTVTDIAIPATNIELDAFSKTMTVGDKAKLTATVKPADTTDKVVWTSSKPTVATVDENGNITALAAGTTEITATAGSVSAVCKVTVEGVKVSEIKLDKTSVSLKAGETAQLTAVVTPDNAADKTVTWTSSDEKIATVADGKITAVAPGTATITATAGGKSATCTVTVAKEAQIIKDPKKYPGVPKDYAKVDPVVTTVNSDGTKNMLVMFSISDSDVKNFRGARITFKRADGKTFSRSLILGKYYTDVTYVKDGDSYNGNSQNYIVIRLRNVDDSWGDISAKFELINGLG